MPPASLRFRPIPPVLVAFALLAPASVRAAPPADPATLVTSFVTDLGRMTSDQSLSASDRERAFGRILAADCDLSRIAHYALGSYFASAGDVDREQYDSLFARWVTQIFAGRLGGFAATSFSVTSVAPAADGAIVSSTITDSEHPVHIDWRVSTGTGGYRIVDVAMEGISIAQVEREEIGDVLRRNGGTVAGLNRALEARLASDDVAAAAPAAAPPAPAPAPASVQITVTTSSTH